MENLHAPSLRNGGPDTLAEWSDSQISQFLQSGANHSGIAFGSMSDVIVNSTQFLSAEDSAATAKYLKTLQDAPADRRARFAYDERTDRELASGDAKRRDALLYLDNCAARHRPDGRGYEGVFPSLAGNPVVEADNPLRPIAHLEAAGPYHQLVVSSGRAILSFAVDPRHLLLRIRQAEGHHVVTVVGRMRRSTHGD